MFYCENIYFTVLKLSSGEDRLLKLPQSQVTVANLITGVSNGVKIT